MQLKHAIPDDVCIIEVHYYFNDDSHTMDAFTLNKCEAAFLRLISSVAATCGTKVTIETEARLEGGLISRYLVKEKDSKRRKHSGLPREVTIALLTAIFTIPTTIAVSGINETVKVAVAEWMKDPETKQLEKEKLKLDVENAKADLEIKKGHMRETFENERLELEVERAEQDFRWRLIKLNKKADANKQRLNFYKTLAENEKVKSISAKARNSRGIDVSPEIFAERSEFDVLGADGTKQLEKAGDSLRYLLPHDVVRYQTIEDKAKKLNSGKQE